jgi:hypothetical protein
MKHGLPETMQENFEIRFARIAKAEKALKRCYDFNDSWVTSEIDRALGCLNIARLQVEKMREIYQENHPT